MGSNAREKDLQVDGPKASFLFCFKIFKDLIHLFFREGEVIYFLEREGKEKERKRNINVWLPLTHPQLGSWPTTQACALDWESNQQPFDSQAGTQSTEPHQPGCSVFLFDITLFH